MAIVLLVSSSADEREMYAEYLRGTGMNVVEEWDTAHAVEAAADLGADVVVTTLSGRNTDPVISLIRELRDQPATAGVPILVVTGRVFGDDQERAVGAGCDVLLTKALTPDLLAAEIHRAMDGGNAQVATASTC